MWPVSEARNATASSLVSLTSPFRSSAASLNWPANASNCSSADRTRADLGLQPDVVKLTGQGGIPLRLRPHDVDKLQTGAAV